ncbi:hypothetical protein RDI58_000712 [Solanum bulbocastanum]|uniref:Uncharacterized protein n=1 Tax=Solanum bulbocastanum TaxID=147425 RepID=A0AAN8U6N8_SOLBU
MNGRGKIHPHS